MYKLYAVCVLATITISPSHGLEPVSPSIASPVEIRCAPDSETFPVMRFASPDRKSPYSANPLAAGEIDRSEHVLREELRKFPPALLKRYLDRIYLLQDLRYQDVEVGGVNFRQTRTICLSAGPGATESFIARLLDHELTHLLISGRGSGFPFREWARINPPTFRYGNGGIEAIRAGMTMGDGDDSCRAQGFARPYGMSDINEDAACIGEMLFSGDPTFWSSVDRVDSLRAKTEMLAKYFSSLDPELNIDLFRLMPPSPFVARSNRFESGELIYFADGGKIVAPSDPLRIVSVPAGGAALFPDRSGVSLNTRPTTLAPEMPQPKPELPMPAAPLGYRVAPGEMGGWLIYAEGRGLVKTGGAEHFIYREGDQIYFPFGGHIWKPGSGDAEAERPGGIAAYTPGSIVVLDPRH